MVPSAGVDAVVLAGVPRFRYHYISNIWTERS